jgi:hypothetical protein
LALILTPEISDSVKRGDDPTGHPSGGILFHFQNCLENSSLCSQKKISPLGVQHHLIYISEKKSSHLHNMEVDKSRLEIFFSFFEDNFNWDMLKSIYLDWIGISLHSKTLMRQSTRVQNSGIRIGTDEGCYSS